MGQLTVILVVLLVLGFIFWRVNKSESNDVIGKKEKTELVKLRVLKHRLVHLSMQNVVADPFAQIVLDEIAKYEQGELGNDNT